MTKANSWHTGWLNKQQLVWMCCTQASPAWYIEISSRWTTWCQWTATRWNSSTLGCQRSVLHHRGVYQLHREKVFFSSSPLYFLLSFLLNVMKLIYVCSALGTIRWGAPETFDYPALWTDKADIYSLGMTFWEIASRKVPFEDVSPPHFTIRTSPSLTFLICFLLPCFIYLDPWCFLLICMIGANRCASHPCCTKA